MNMQIKHVGIADGLEDQECFPAITTEPVGKYLIVGYETDDCIFSVKVSFSALEQTISDLVHLYGIREQDITISVA